MAAMSEIRPEYSDANSRSAPPSPPRPHDERHARLCLWSNSFFVVLGTCRLRRGVVTASHHLS